MARLPGPSSSLLATSALAFTILKFAGAAYLLYLGIRLWRSPVAPIEAEVAGIPASRSILLHLYVVTALNPKGILFFLAFLPQFLKPEAGGMEMQMALLGLQFMVQTLVIFGAIGGFAAALGHWLRRHAAAGPWLDRAAGAVFVAVALRLAMGA